MPRNATTDMARRTDKPLTLAVVGHTNTGKTSLLRTLTRDATFGEVAPTAATTRQVEGAALAVDGRTVVELFDTPGMEDAGAVFDALDAAGGGRHDGPDRIRALLDDPGARRRFDQECRVLEQVLASDAALSPVVAVDSSRASSGDKPAAEATEAASPSSLFSAPALTPASWTSA